MPFTKPALSIVDQAALLIGRGLVAEADSLEAFLTQVNYYRLSGYLFPFKRPGEENFIEGTLFTAVRDRYNFDRRLRLLLLDAIEKIEISVLRSQFVERFGLNYGTFGFMQRNNFKDKELHPADFHEKLLEFSAKTLAEDRADFVVRYRQNYPDEERLPIWILVEKMTFGQLSTLIGNLQRADRIHLANRFEISAKVFVSWLHAIANLRNLCAHHERLWNRYISVEPAIPDYKNGIGFHEPIVISRYKKELFCVIVVIQYLLNYIEPQNNWGDRLQGLLKDYEHLPIREIGFPENWIDVPFWGNLLA